MIRRLLASLAAALGIPAAASEALMEVPMLDPWVPPALRKDARIGEPASGAALRLQVERKLRERFDAAAAAHGGVLTREQARAGGLGFVAEHFDAIAAGAPAVRYEDYRRFLVRRGAKLD